MARSDDLPAVHPQLASDWSADEIREAVLEIFESCRQAPGTPFTTQRFLIFLTAERTTAALDEGNGRSRFIKFYKKVEDRFQIWIGYQKWRTNWDLDEFCNYLARAKKSPKSGVREACYHTEQTAVAFMVLSVCVMLVLWYFCQMGEVGIWISGAIVLAYLPIVGFVLHDYRRYRKIIRSNQS